MLKRNFQRIIRLGNIFSFTSAKVHSRGKNKAKELGKLCSLMQSTTTNSLTAPTS